MVSCIKRTIVCVLQQILRRGNWFLFLGKYQPELLEAVCFLVVLTTALLQEELSRKACVTCHANLLNCSLSSLCSSGWAIYANIWFLQRKEFAEAIRSLCSVLWLLFKIVSEDLNTYWFHSLLSVLACPPPSSQQLFYYLFIYLFIFWLEMLVAQHKSIFLC